MILVILSIFNPIPHQVSVNGDGEKKKKKKKKDKKEED